MFSLEVIKSINRDVKNNPLKHGLPVGKIVYINGKPKNPLKPN